MTTSATTRTASRPTTSFLDLFASEWLKLRSLRSTYWALGSGALAVIAFNANAARADFVNYPHYGEPIHDDFVFWALRDAFTLGSAMITILACASIGALTVVGEYATGLIRTTFTAVPDRRALMAAKVAVVTTVMTVFGVVVAGVSFAATQAILAGRDASVSLDEPGAVRVIAASALLAPVCALVGMGLGALIRHGATTMVLTTGVLLLAPAFVTDRYHWTACVRNALPYNAWMRLVDIGYGREPYTLASRYPTSVTGGWVVFAVWALAGAVVAVMAVDRRDV